MFLLRIFLMHRVWIQDFTRQSSRTTYTNNQ